MTFRPRTVAVKGITFLEQLPGQWFALSRSAPGTVHTIGDLGTGMETCGCLRFAHKGRCAHAAAAGELLAGLMEASVAQVRRARPRHTKQGAGAVAVRPGLRKRIGYGEGGADAQG